VIRLFTALELPDTAKTFLAATAGGVPGARWVPTENMHITLCFIGNVDEATAGDLAAALSAVRVPAFDVAIEGAGYFSRGPKPTMLWAGVARSEALTHLQEKIESALVRAGAAPEARKFTPHVTLARLNGAPRTRVEAFVADHALMRLPPFRASHFTLFSSYLGHDHPTYVAETTYPLDG
jgi:2'-5' RNA ligase